MVESVDVSPTPLRYWYSFSPTKPGFPTDSEDGATVLKAYEKSLPMRSGPPFHGEYLLEAQEPSKGAPFSNTIIGRLPSEIREDIYISALTIDPVPDHLKYHYKPRAQQIWPAEWSRDHQPTTESSAQRRWPHDYEALSSLSPAFVATFPSRANPKVRSRLHLLLTWVRSTTKPGIFTTPSIISILATCHPWSISRPKSHPRGGEKSLLFRLTLGILLRVKDLLRGLCIISLVVIICGI